MAKIDITSSTAEKGAESIQNFLGKLLGQTAIVGLFILYIVSIFHCS
jgi:hypothetical protein